VPRLVGAFDLGGALSPFGFAPDDDARGFASRPLFYAGVGGAEIVLVDLALAADAAILSPSTAFSPLEDPDVYGSKRGPVLVGLDAAGKVIRYGLYDPRIGPELVTSQDLGLGATASGVDLFFRND
jgi:hypothetical protein